MDGGLRLGHLLVITLLLGSLAWTLVAGQLPGPTLNSFRPLFIGRCQEYQHFLYPHLFNMTKQLKDCQQLWKSFYNSFAGRGQCNTDTQSYEGYIEAAKHDINKLNQLQRLLYWTGPLKSLADELCAGGRRYVTINNYLPGYIVTNVKTWCGKTNSRDDDVNFDECWTSSSCAEGMIPTDSFWKALSAHVASFVKGEVHLLLNGSSGQAYNNRSTFAQYELPYLNNSRNPLIRALLVHAIETDAQGVERETCDSGSLVDLKRDVEAKNITFKCEEDPAEVLHLLCVDNPWCLICMNLRSAHDGKRCWKKMENTLEWGRQGHTAPNLEACQDACFNIASCVGVEWNPGQQIGGQCLLNGLWTPSRYRSPRQVSVPGSTQYLLNRTYCGKTTHAKYVVAVVACVVLAVIILILIIVICFLAIRKRR